eukprot:TRINITY_DN90682_c0_g1_i1.p1 TRINITY_DN90682_c0_g1~~TRINITY_DN90682_c0_g1_i1.p1  ORF type:complete len:577 (-),score=179.12 TRINITY_DN90682_c0_g1_i1:68-1648(-)
MAAVERTRSTAAAISAGLRLFIAGIPWRLDEDTLWRDFEECGVVEDLFILRDAQGNSKGRAFITFRDAEGAKKALEYNDTEYGGRKIFVQVCEEKRGTKPHGSRPAAEQSPGSKPQGCTTLCLKRLGQATEEDIKAFLKTCKCKVQAVRVAKDKKTGESRGIAFVDFSSTEDVDKAMQHNGADLAGNSVEMHYEAPKVGEGKVAAAAAASFPVEKPDGCVSLCVKNIGSASEADLRKQLFSKCEVQSIRIVKDRVTGQPRGIAFVDFPTTDQVDIAMKSNGKTMKGQELAVEMNFEAPRARPRPAGCMSVAVKKLPAEATEKDVQKLFAGLDSIEDLRLIRDKDQNCTGLAFVEFSQAADVEKAIKRDGMTVGDNIIFICYETKGKQERKDDGNRGGSKGGGKGAESSSKPDKKRKEAADAEADDAQQGGVAAEVPIKKKKKKAQAVEDEKGEAAEAEAPAEDAQEAQALPAKKKRKKAAASASVPESTPLLPAAKAVEAAAATEGQTGKAKKKRKKKADVGTADA